MISDKIYNLVLYNYPVKRIVRRILGSAALVKNPVYGYFYSRLMRRKMLEYSLKPHRVMIENTNLCDANCSFCPHGLMRRNPGVMDLELSKKIIDECAALKIDYLTIYGFGEPFLDNCFFERVSYAKSRGISRVTTNTNAAYMDSRINSLLINSGIDEIYISFDALTSDVYKKIRPNLNFDKVRANILDLINQRDGAGKKKPLIVLSFVENKFNRHQVSDYIRYWNNKVDFVSVSAAHNWTGNVGDREFCAYEHRDPCRLLWTDMFVLHNGDVALCCNDFDGRVIIGNLRLDSVESVWSGKELSEVRKKHFVGRFNDVSICKGCNYNLHHKSNWWVSK